VLLPILVRSQNIMGLESSSFMHVSKTISHFSNTLTFAHHEEPLNLNALKPSDIPSFDIDLDKPMSERYTEVWDYFLEDMVHMENLFVRQLNGMNSSYLQFFEDHQDQF